MADPQSADRDGVLHRARRQAARILFSFDKEDRWTRRFDVGLILLVSLNVLAVVFESVASIRAAWGPWFHAFEVFSVAVFTVEYVLRVWSAVDNPWQARYRHPVIGRLRFARTPMALVDLLAILPFYLGLLLPVDLRFLRVLRLLRIFKLTRYSGSMNLLFQVMRHEGRTLGAAMFILTMMLVITSSLAFIVEGDAHPSSSMSFSSIPATMYWAVITMTGVGYGDIVPVTALGRALTALISVISVGIVALPAGILASGFSAAVQRRREEMEHRLEDALMDGELTAGEQEEISDLVERLDISAADLRMLTEAARRSVAEQLPCPHCGRTRGERPTAG